MRVLIGCEESQVVCKAFRKRGHEAYSCDLKQTRGDPLWHFDYDVMDAIDKHKWDLIILHPDCTAMAVSGNRWYGRGMVYNQERVKAIEWTMKLWNKAISSCDKVVLENPVSVIFTTIKEISNEYCIQYIQPYDHGHGETKKTGLALHGLPKLKPTNEVSGRDQRIWKMAPGPNRKRDRSETYQGIADAMADQWGNK